MKNPAGLANEERGSCVIKSSVRGKEDGEIKVEGDGVERQSDFSF